jgi:DNA-binding CsgD family transcriptional regulator
MSSRSLAPATIPAKSGPVLWEALSQDASVQVAVIDADGEVRFANEAFARAVADREPRAVVGQTLDRLLPEDFAAERLQIIRSVVLGGKPLQLRSIWRGVRQRVFFRPLPAKIDGKRAVLAVIRPEQGAEPESGGPRVLQARHVDEGPLASVSPRERMVLSLIGQGMSTAQMAQTLGRSAKTIENQRYSLARKLNARNRVELARIALRAGLCAQASVPPVERPRRRARA